MLGFVILFLCLNPDIDDNAIEGVKITPKVFPGESLEGIIDYKSEPEVYDIIKFQESDITYRFIRDVILKSPNKQYKIEYIRFLGRSSSKDSIIDSLLIMALEDSLGDVRKAALTSLAWRKREWTIPYIRRHLTDSLCCGKVVHVLHGYFNYFTTDSLLMVASKGPCREAKVRAIEAIKEGVFWYVLKEKNIIEWTPELRDSILSFAKCEDRKVRNSALRVLATSHDKSVFPFFREKMKSFKEELARKVDDEGRKEVMKHYLPYLIEFSRLGDSRAVPIVMKFLRDAIKRKPDDRILAHICLLALEELRPYHKICELETLGLLADDEEISRKIENRIEFWKHEREAE